MDVEEKRRHMLALMNGLTDQWFPMMPHERQKVFEARRKICKELIHADDDTPKKWTDYSLLMEFEIEASRLAAMRSAERRWYEFCQHVPELKAVYQELLLSGKYQNIPSDEVREIRLKRAAVRDVTQDLRILGALETLFMGGTYWGLDP